mgnify:CR=1 FL=1
MIVAFLRHGSTAWNEQGRMQGRRDVPLSERGRDEVRAWRLPSASTAVPPVEPTWVSSPLRRAVETAEILSGATPQCESALIEMDWGEWEGFDLDELRRRHGEAFARNEAAGLDFRPPGGESPREVRDRVMSWLAANATHRDGHGGRHAQGRIARGARRGHRLGHDRQAPVAPPTRRTASLCGRTRRAGHGAGMQCSARRDAHRGATAGGSQPIYMTGGAVVP